MLSVNTLLEKRIQELSLLPTAFEIDWDNDQMVENYPFNTHFIPHDRIDRYTGIDIDGDKVFERDEVEAEKTWHCEGGGSDIHTQKWKAVIKYFPSRGEYRLCMKGASSTRNLYEMEIIKITGIQGVKDES
jgi:hypothetical protein